jgi:hypothetical protein
VRVREGCSLVIMQMRASSGTCLEGEFELVFVQLHTIGCGPSHGNHLGGTFRVTTGSAAHSRLAQWDGVRRGCHHDSRRRKDTTEVDVGHFHFITDILCRWRTFRG